MATPFFPRLLAAALAMACLFIGMVATPLHAQAPDPAKVQELADKFAKGKALISQSQYPEAAAQFEEIIAEVPDARGSLLLAGFAYLEMGDYKKSAERLNQFQKLEPEDVQGIIWAIQANQALGRDIKVRKLIATLKELRDAGKPLTGLKGRSEFIRQRQKQDDGSLIVITEYFDYKAEPYRLWTAEQIDKDGIVQRRMALSFDEDATKEAVEKLKGKGGDDLEVFFLSEYVMEGGELAKINVYKQEFERPSYTSAKKMFLDAIANPPTPIHTEEVGG